MKYVLIFLILCLGAGCIPAPKDKKDILPPPETSYGSKRAYSNMVEYMFMQMMDTSEKLREIVELQSELGKDQEKIDELWMDYQQYEDTYVKSAMRLLNGDSSMDSSLKAHLLQDLDAFKERQSARLSILNSIRDKANTESVFLSQQMNALKIWATLPLLEKYLIETMPDTAHWQNFRHKMYKQGELIQNYPPYQNDSL